MCQRTFRQIRSLGIISEMYSKGNKHKRQIITSVKIKLCAPKKCNPHILQGLLVNNIYIF